MSKTDSQLKSNDCGISAIKTVFTIFEKNISRKYIESHVAIEQKGSRLADIKDFFDQHGFESSYQLLDFDLNSQNETSIDNYFPFIIPFKRKSNLHYLVANGRKGNRIRVHDPSKGA
jgi:subfamily B ATP-binding cassette protein HlyB/CyaB